MTYDNFVKIFKLSRFYKQVTVEVACDKSITLTSGDGKKILIMHDLKSESVVVKTSDVGLSHCPFNKISFHADLTNGVYSISVPLSELSGKYDAAKLIKWIVIDCLINGERTKVSFWRRLLNFLKFWG